MEIYNNRLDQFYDDDDWDELDEWLEDDNETAEAWVRMARADDGLPYLDDYEPDRPFGISSSLLADVYEEGLADIEARKRTETETESHRARRIRSADMRSAEDHFLYVYDTTVSGGIVRLVLLCAAAAGVFIATAAATHPIGLADVLNALIVANATMVCWIILLFAWGLIMDRYDY